MIDFYNLQKRLYGKISLCDGATGTLLMEREDINVGDIHREYIEAGADIIRTATFMKNPIDASAVKEEVKEIRSYHQVCTQREQEVLVAGSIGVAKQESTDTFYDRMVALLDGSCDLIWIETIYDMESQNKATKAIEKLGRTYGGKIPYFISVTLNEEANKLLDGRCIADFVNSLKGECPNPAAIGFNCGFGPYNAEDALKELRVLTDFPIIFCPAAGMGGVRVGPDEFSEVVKNYIDAGLVDIVGGCCGTTPEHIAKLRNIL